MKLISHRGNLNGKNTEKENNPNYILEALEFGFDVEIDVWVVDNVYYLGHDEPMYEIKERFLENDYFWCHAKNYEALYKMLENKKIHCFWHQEDDHTITSNGFIWSYPSIEKNYNSICVLPETNKLIKEQTQNYIGVCSDFILNYK